MGPTDSSTPTTSPPAAYSSAQAPVHDRPNGTRRPPSVPCAGVCSRSPTCLAHLLHAGRTQRSWPERSWRRTSNPSDVSPRGLAGQGRHARLDSAAETRHSSIEVDHPLSLSIRPRPERRAHRTTPGETRRCIPNRGSGVHRPIGLAAPESVICAHRLPWETCLRGEQNIAARDGRKTYGAKSDVALGLPEARIWASVSAASSSPPGTAWA
jgi:hypothetical protein